MTPSEPSQTEITLTLVVGALASNFYRSYVRRLPLLGGERVLDFGSGSGVCTRHLAARLKRGGGRVTCVDISHHWYEVIQKNLSSFHNIDYRLGDIEQVNLPNRTYDAIFIHFVLHDIPAADRPRITRALAHKLKPGGQWFVREPVERGGMAAEEVQALLCGLGFLETSAGWSSHPLTGKVYEGVYR